MKPSLIFLRYTNFNSYNDLLFDVNFYFFF